MNYSHDTEMDLDWESDQRRRRRQIDNGVGGEFSRSTRTPLLLKQDLNEMMSETCTLKRTQLETLLSALAIHSHSDENCLRVCEDLLALISDSDRVAFHGELARVGGLEMVLSVVRERRGEAVFAALRLLDKLARTCARQMNKAGGVDFLITKLDDAQYSRATPRMLEGILRVLLGVSFDNECRGVLLRRGVDSLVEALLERTHGPDYHELGVADEAEVQALQNAISVATRLLQRLGGGKGRSSLASRRRAA